MVLFPLRVAAYVALLTSLIMVQAAIFKRQAAPTVPLIGITETPSNTPTIPPAMSTVTTIVIITSTAEPSALNHPVVSTFTATYTQSGHTSLSTATVTFDPAYTGSVPHRVSTPFVPSVTQPADEHSTSNKGAIAGGVIGALAVIVAAFGAFVWFRRRSPRHWRNRAAGRWQNFDSKDASGARARSIYMGEPAYRAHGDIKQADPHPLPPLYIRDRQPTVGDPFEDEPSSPTSLRGHSRVGSISNASRHHHRGGSNSGGFDVELQPTTGSSPR